MVMFYFSGTGNSKYLAELFSSKIGAGCHSIEEETDFGRLIEYEETIGFCYPVYGSRVPRIMREFAIKFRDALKDKNVIIFCTQMTFSGDGARAFTDLFSKNFFNVIYAEHFFMPNNIWNFFLLPQPSEKKIKDMAENADTKMEAVCKNISAGVIKKRGFNAFSRLLGLTQGAAWPGIEDRAMRSVKIDSDCTKCRLCITICPMHNLELENSEIVGHNNCTVCYRCVNQCPQQAITVMVHKKVKRQYMGIKTLK